ncbi:hypothetical protein Taro_000635, partial [Colocasia esculenta]|nr:hypothetical protein [Colocasia esculenta]
MGLQISWAAVVVVVLCCGSLASLYRGGCRQESATSELEAPDCYFCSLSLGVVYGGTDECVVPSPRGVSEVQGGSACGPSTLWRSEMVVFGVRADGCFGIVFDTAGSAGVLSGPTWLWVVALLFSTALTVGCCPGEGCSQDYFRLVSAGCCAISGLRYAVVVLASAFWWVSQNDALVVLVEVLPGPACVAAALLVAGKAFVAGDLGVEHGGTGGSSCGAWSGIVERGGGVLAIEKALWGSVLHFP